MINTENRDHFQDLISSESPVCALFTADWCPDCVVIKPVMPELEQEYSGRYRFVSVDRDAHLDLCRELNVFGIPSFIVFRGGRETARFVSTERKTRDQIEEFLNRAETL